MNPIKLSILILTVPDRVEKCRELLTSLESQRPPDESVEIIVEENLPVSQGGPTIGANRNAALDYAAGDYVCFIDDDDKVSGEYIEKILRAIETKPDVVGMKGHYIVGKSEPQLFVHSIQYKEWKTVDGVHQRCPNHLNPVKRELALQVGYPEKNHGEDTDYSMKLLPLLKTEVMIDDVIYYYLK